MRKHCAVSCLFARGGVRKEFSFGFDGLRAPCRLIMLEAEGPLPSSDIGVW